jgi:hypothetical protein
VCGSPAATPRAHLEAALVALIDSFGDLRPEVAACVEDIAPAMRSDPPRVKLAAGCAESRQAGVAMITRAAHVFI